MKPADTSNLAHPADRPPEAPEAPWRAFSASDVGVGQLALLPLPGQQIALDGRTEGRSPEPSLGPLRGVSDRGPDDPPPPCPAQLVLDLADVELVPQLPMWDRHDIAASILPWDTNESKCHRTQRTNDPVKVYRTERGAWSFCGLVNCNKWACAHCGTSRAPICCS